VDNEEQCGYKVMNFANQARAGAEYNTPRGDLGKEEQHLV
jgi:hypothetical protein